MTKNELAEARKIADSDELLSEDNASIYPFDGFGLTDFQPVYVTLKQVARLIRWQCFRMDGTIDEEEFQCIAQHGKRKFLIIG